MKSVGLNPQRGNSLTVFNTNPLHKNSRLLNSDTIKKH